MARGSEWDAATADTHQIQALFREVSAGLRSDPKRIPEKLLYDDRGSELFEQITRLDAYYPTRTEIAILRRCLREIRRLVGPAPRVVEFGTGDGTKTTMLLDALDGPSTCTPIDIAEAQLLASADRLRVRYPDMQVLPLALDYTRPFVLPESRGDAESEPVLFFFPGSTIGNFEPHRAEEFLERVGAVGGPRAALVIGVDLVKPASVLHLAYDDPEGVTAEFNLNALRHLNRLLDGDFAVPLFEHRAIWNPSRSRIEMHLVSSAAQEVTLGRDLPDVEPLEIAITAGEAIVTEHSYKYRPAQFAALCLRAGWRTARCWTDPKEWFAVYFLEREG